MGIKKRKLFFRLSVWQPGALGMSDRLLCFPELLELGDHNCRAGLVGGGEERGDPAGVWLRSNPGDYYCWDTHTHKHQRWYLLLASVLIPVVSPGQR